MKGLGLYVHIPFCKSKCFYCDFNSYSGMEGLQESYVDSLIKEIDMQMACIGSDNIVSIYIGGGTPTYLNFPVMRELLAYLQRYASDNMEYTCEANPGTLTRDKLMLMRDMGVNRLSIGLQSWNDSILKKLGRIHTLKDFIENYSCARSVGFSNINIDLMFSIPGQTIDDFENTLDNVIALKPQHISCYSLIIEEGTVFWKQYQEKLLKENDEEVDRCMYDMASHMLKQQGFRRYEISNYAREGYECRHNILYWRTMPYLGVGPGAHSYIDGVRYSNELSIEKYIECIGHLKKPVVHREILSGKDMMAEFMFMGLRMMAGIEIEEFKHRFGRDLYDVYGPGIDKMTKLGLLELNKGRLALTDRGIGLSNQVFVEFV